MISPGKTIGVLGGGEHGRMLTQAATRLGYRVHIYEPRPGRVAGPVAHREINAAYDDLAALTAFAKDCDVVTSAFAGVPVASLQVIESLAQLHPHWSVLEACHDQARQTSWLLANKFPPAPRADRAAAGPPDTFASEVAVVMVRSARAAIRVFPLVENIHTNHILDFSIVPARVAPEITAAAEKMARLIAEKIGLVGVMGVEMLVTRDGRVLVNELVPRTPNSGHYTIDACATSQFEQQVRAICGLPLGDTRLIAPVVMVNILGDAWAKGEPKWDVLLAEPAVRLHLYGKAEPRPGRKMGHFTVTARDADMALGFAQKIKARLAGGRG